jgi:hypothetical protein
LAASVDYAAVMKKTRATTLAVVVGALLAVGASGPVSAHVIITQSGVTGDWGWLPADDPSSPGARCGYTAPQGDGYAHLRWIRVRPPEIAARNVTGGVDSQKASWQVVVQRKIGAGAWRKVAQSPVQTKTTWDNQSADYTGMKVYFASGQANQQFRAVAFLRWMRNGAVEGSVKARMEHYGVKWTVGTPDYVFADACTGVAD